MASVKFPDVYSGASRVIESLKAGKMDGLPLGITVHHLADRNIDASVASLRAEKLGYHAIIDRDGEFIQCCNFTDRVNHAGKATWCGVSPNRRHIAVAFSSWGEVNKNDNDDGFGYKSWSGAKVNLFEVAQRKGNLDNIWRNWDAATIEQEHTLIKFLRWCIAFGVDPKNICGHDECAIPFGRKNDPGGVLSISMLQLRAVLSMKD